MLGIWTFGPRCRAFCSCGGWYHIGDFATASSWCWACLLSHVVVTPVSTRASAGIAPPLSSLQLNLSVLTGVVRIAPILSLRLCEDRAHLVTVPSIFCCCPTTGSSPQVRVGFCFSSWFDVSCMLSASVLSSSAFHFGVRCDIARVLRAFRHAAYP